MWMDWMAQGTRVTGNLCYDNSLEDIFLEVNHGPYLVDNNLFLSDRSIWNMSEGGAFAHNLIAGQIDNWFDLQRLTPWLQPHSTAMGGLSVTKEGDDRYFNNIFVGRGAGSSGYVSNPNARPTKSIRGFGLWVYDARNFPLLTGGNIHLNGARPYARETDHVEQGAFDPDIRVVEEGDRVYLNLALGEACPGGAAALVTTDRLGKTAVSNAAFVNSDNSPLRIDADYFGKPRNQTNPTPGPFESPGSGSITLTVW
jgi:hypothetical protein